MFLTPIYGYFHSNFQRPYPAMIDLGQQRDRIGRFEHPHGSIFSTIFSDLSSFQVNREQIYAPVGDGG